MNKKCFSAYLYHCAESVQQVQTVLHDRSMPPLCPENCFLGVSGEI